MPASLEEVSRRAGVSISTASRILSNDPHYSFKSRTRQRVLDACHDLQYQPNLAARALASGRSCIVAFVVPRVQETPFTALGSLQVLAGLEEAFSARGYHILLSSPRLADGNVDPAFTQLMQSGYLEGIILDGHFAVDPLLQSLQRQRLPCVTIGHPNYPYTIRADDDGGYRMLVAHLVELGHRQIGIIGLDHTLFPSGRHRLAALRAAADRHGLTAETMPYVESRFGRQHGVLLIRQLLAEHPGLTALVALNDRLALDALHALRTLGVRVPEDLAVAGHDDLPQAADVLPSLTTINQGLHRWGEYAADMLFALAAGGEPEAVVMQTRLVVRDSTAPPSAAPALPR
ncbi:MAG: LacI family transcriptional regulator [Chloroflexi bacterium]|nr:LacI family transcriptional regulator [Chloroflexota bacterium]